MYTEIEKYRSKSGFHWDNEKGAGIEGNDAGSVFDTYVKEVSYHHTCPDILVLTLVTTV